jgi:RNA-binding protein 39
LCRQSKNRNIGYSKHWRERKEREERGDRREREKERREREREKERREREREKVNIYIHSYMKKIESKERERETGHDSGIQRTSDVF